MAALTVLSATLAALGYAHSTALVLMLMALNGAAAWAVATPNNHRLTALVPRLPTVVISYNSSGIYLGQALGSALGGLLLAHGTSASTLCLVGTVLGLCALGSHLLLRRPPAAQLAESRA